MANGFSPSTGVIEREEEPLMTDIAILGNGVAANLAAAHFSRSMPDLTMAVIGSVDKRRPIVGEALVEVSTNFIREIGLVRSSLNGITRNTD